MIKTRYLLATGLVAATCGTVVGAATGTTTDTPSSDRVEPDAPTLLDSVGITPDDMEPATRTRSGAQLYLSEHDGTVCIVDAAGGGHCAPEDGLDDGFGFGGELCQADLAADMARITALVPDGVRAVELLAGDERIAASSPVKQTVAFEVPRWAAAKVTRAVLRSDSGVREVPVPVPPLPADAPCGESDER